MHAGEKKWINDQMPLAEAAPEKRGFSEKPSKLTVLAPPFKISTFPRILHAVGSV
jgi:hypothetical protein